MLVSNIVLQHDQPSCVRVLYTYFLLANWSDHVVCLLTEKQRRASAHAHTHTRWFVWHKTRALPQAYNKQFIYLYMVVFPLCCVFFKHFGIYSQKNIVHSCCCYIVISFFFYFSFAAISDDFCLVVMHTLAVIFRFFLLLLLFKSFGVCLWVNEICSVEL